MGCCDQFARERESDHGPNVKCYLFEELAIPARMDEAAKAAVDAELLVFAVTPEGDLPPAIKLWTEGWLSRRENLDGYLVGLVLEEGAEVRGVAGLKEVYLRHLAHRAGMDYLSHFPSGKAKVIPNSLDDFNQRAEQMTPLLDEILHQHFVPHEVSRM